MTLLSSTGSNSKTYSQNPKIMVMLVSMISTLQLMLAPHNDYANVHLIISKIKSVHKTSILLQEEMKM